MSERKLYSHWSYWLDYGCACVTVFLLELFQDWMIKRVVDGTATLELAKQDSRQLAPVSSTYGAITVRGNALPAFSYQVFDNPKMEFVQVTAYVSKHRISYECVTEDLGLVRTLPTYKRPMLKLALFLSLYFPLMAERKEPPRVVA